MSKLSLKVKIIIFVIIFFLIGVILFLLWGYWTGRLRFGAETIFGCQNTSKISATVGSPGTNLMTYSLFGKEVTINKNIAPSLDNIQKEVNALNTGYSFDDIQTLNYRSKRGGGGLSLHSFGIAIDINPSRNPLQPGKRSEIQMDIPESIINAFRKNGFFWGGDWTGYADPMHFEWYGGKVYGSILDSQSGQKIISGINSTIDGTGIPVDNGDYNIAVESINPHKIITSAKGYATDEFELKTECFQNKRLDIYLTPLPENTPGSISGKISISNNMPLLIPATIYLDDKIVGTSNLNGEYLITGVRRGAHQVSAKIMMFPGASVNTPEMAVGENIGGVNIVIGR